MMQMELFLMILYHIEEDGEELDQFSYEEIPLLSLALPVLTHSPVLHLSVGDVRPLHFRGLRMESGATIPDWSGKKQGLTSNQTGLLRRLYFSYQTGLVSNEYLLLNRPVWYEVGAYFLPDWSGKKAVLFLPDWSGKK